MKRFRSLSFLEFVLEYNGHAMDVNSNVNHNNYKTALEYTIKFLGDYLDNKGMYNSQQAKIILDRTARKFNLTPEERNNLEIDVFDWENQDNDDMNAGIEEKHDYRHSPNNMKGYIDKIFKSGRSNVRSYQEFKVPVQK